MDNPSTPTGNPSTSLLPFPSSSSPTHSPASPPPAPPPPLIPDLSPPHQSFSPITHFNSLLTQDPDLPLPLASVATLAKLISISDAGTMQGLLSQVGKASQLLINGFRREEEAVGNNLKRGSGSKSEADDAKPIDLVKGGNPIGVTAGTDLFLRFITSQRPSTLHPTSTPSASSQAFKTHKTRLSLRALEFVEASKKGCPKKIAETLEGEGFLAEGVTILTHSYSNLVVGSLLHAARGKAEGGGGKRFGRVLVAEGRPLGLGVKTHKILTNPPDGIPPIPTTLLLDSAVAYVMQKVDLVLLGAEAVGTDGGLVGKIGGYQIALIAKAYRKPVYALAESFKFSRIFPLSQTDIPTPGNRPPLRLTSSSPPEPSKIHSPSSSSDKNEELMTMTREQLEDNPYLDYTTPNLVDLVVSDVGCLTTSGISDTLLTIFGGE